MLSYLRGDFTCLSKALLGGNWPDSVLDLVFAWREITSHRAQKKIQRRHGNLVELSYMIQQMAAVASSGGFVKPGHELRSWQGVETLRGTEWQQTGRSRNG